MSLALFTDPGLFLNVPKAEEVYNEGCPVENTPFPLPAPETEISLDIGSVSYTHLTLPTTPYV